jgi:cytochrome c oxidase assembly factor CtaG
VQHTILINIAAPLIILGRPVLVSLWALPGPNRKRVALHTLPSTLRAISEMPIWLAFLLHSVAIWLWHAPPFYDAAVRHDWVHALQHLSFLGTALIFWNAVLAPRARAHALGQGVFFVFATAAHTAVLGALITLAATPLYRVYDHAGAAHFTPLEDQQLAGLIMWVPAGLLYTFAGAALLLFWLRQTESRNALRGFAAGSALLIALLATTACEDFTRGDALDERSAAMLTGGDPRVGKQAMESLGCGGCHTIEGVRDANGTVGPSLNGLAQRTYIAGVLTNTPTNLTRWIVDPKAVDSLTAMPKLGITPKQARDIAAYLYTLR